MISKKDVITMRIPFPNIGSGLAKRSHMYVCTKDGHNKEFVKCQTFKPTHLIDTYPPTNYIIEEADLQRNPFTRKTTIDCDKYFFVENVKMDLGLLASRNICDELFCNINKEISDDNCYLEILSNVDLIRLNSLIQAI